MAEPADLGDPAGPAVPEGFVAVAASSPFSDLVGPFYQRIVDGRLHRGFRVEPRHTNRLGVVHGGMLLTFADILLGAALGHALDGAPAVTVKLSTDLITAVRRGQWIEGTAEVSRAGRSLVFVRGRAWAGRRTVLTAEGVFQLLGARRRAAK